MNLPHRLSIHQNHDHSRRSNFYNPDGNLSSLELLIQPSGDPDDQLPAADEDYYVGSAIIRYADRNDFAFARRLESRWID
jgi:hypothetical protein